MQNRIIDRLTDLKCFYNEYIKDKLLSKIDTFSEISSGWALHSILELKVNINHYSPLNIGTFVDLPESIKKTHGVLNIKSHDEFCFMWCIVAHLCPVDINRTE